jgi:signal transduction histidine kinase
VAHEINNPLAFVMNNVVVLHRDVAAVRKMVELYQAVLPALAQASPEQHAQIRELDEQIDLAYTVKNLSDMLDRSKEGLKRIKQIVGDLREFSRQETVTELQDAVDLNAAVASTVNIIRGQARGRGVEIETELSPTLPGIICQASKINQVVLNLISNAIDACGRGGKVIVRTRPATDRAGVEVEVVDNGKGIDPAIRDRIFDPFFTTKPQGQGTGLGLSISHGIVSEHGGTISVDSTPGQGSRFLVRLPCEPKAS